MNETVVIDSLGKNMDSLRSTVGWSLLMVFAFGWASIAGVDPVPALGQEIDKSAAIFIAALVYAFVNVKIYCILLRSRALIELLDATESLTKGFSVVALHPVLANPFACFGMNERARRAGSMGVALLVLLWWSAVDTLIWLAESSPNPLEGADSLFFYGFVAILAILGVFSVWAILDWYRYAIEKMERANPTLCRALTRTRSELKRITAVASGAGAIVALVVGPLLP